MVLKDNLAISFNASSPFIATKLLATSTTLSFVPSGNSIFHFCSCSFIIVKRLALATIDAAATATCSDSPLVTINNSTFRGVAPKFVFVNLSTYLLNEFSFTY